MQIQRINPGLYLYDNVKIAKNTRPAARNPFSVYSLLHLSVSVYSRVGDCYSRCSLRSSAFITAETISSPRASLDDLIRASLEKAVIYDDSNIIRG